MRPAGTNRALGNRFAASSLWYRTLPRLAVPRFVKNRHTLARCVVVVALVLASACSWPANRNLRALPYALNGPLVPARMTMVAAWDVPDNPLNDSTLADTPLSAAIRRGYRIFTNTPAEATRFAPGRVVCANCHLNAGQRKRALPLVDIVGMFPQYNKRAGRLFSLGDRIVDCFLRSENATSRLDVLPSPDSEEVLAVSAFVTWLLDTRRGESIFRERCVSCHGIEGQGVAVGDKRPGPLWGPDSWNDGAGAARVYTLAGIVRYTMPYLDPGSLVEPLPPDSVYYRIP